MEASYFSFFINALAFEADAFFLAPSNSPEGGEFG